MKKNKLMLTVLTGATITGIVAPLTSCGSEHIEPQPAEDESLDLPTVEERTKITRWTDEPDNDDKYKVTYTGFKLHKKKIEGTQLDVKVTPTEMAKGGLGEKVNFAFSGLNPDGTFSFTVQVDALHRDAPAGSYDLLLTVTDMNTNVVLTPKDFTIKYMIVESVEIPITSEAAVIMQRNDNEGCWKGTSEYFVIHNKEIDTNEIIYNEDLSEHPQFEGDIDVQASDIFQDPKTNLHMFCIDVILTNNMDISSSTYSFHLVMDTNNTSQALIGDCSIQFLQSMDEPVEPQFVRAISPSTTSNKYEATFTNFIWKNKPVSATLNDLTAKNVRASFNTPAEISFSNLQDKGEYHTFDITISLAKNVREDIYTFGFEIYFGEKLLLQLPLINLEDGSVQDQVKLLMGVGPRETVTQPPIGWAAADAVYDEDLGEKVLVARFSGFTSTNFPTMNMPHAYVDETSVGDLKDYIKRVDIVDSILQSNGIVNFSIQLVMDLDIGSHGKYGDIAYFQPKFIFKSVNNSQFPETQTLYALDKYYHVYLTNFADNNNADAAIVEGSGFYYISDFNASHLCGVDQEDAEPISVEGKGEIERSTFNYDVIINPNATILPENFLSNCTSMAGFVALNDSLVTIGKSFMYNCKTFNQNIYLSSTIDYIDDYFMYECQHMTSIIYWFADGGITPSDEHAYHILSTMAPDAAMLSGVKIHCHSQDVEILKSRLPDLTFAEHGVNRKLIIESF